MMWGCDPSVVCLLRGGVCCPLALKLITLYFVQGGGEGTYLEHIRVQLIPLADDSSTGGGERPCVWRICLLGFVAVGTHVPLYVIKMDQLHSFVYLHIFEGG
jgi:hypothetical protein